METQGRISDVEVIGAKLGCLCILTERVLRVTKLGKMSRESFLSLGEFYETGVPPRGKFLDEQGYGMEPVFRFSEDAERHLLVCNISSNMLLIFDLAPIVSGLGKE